MLILANDNMSTGSDFQNPVLCTTAKVVENMTKKQFFYRLTVAFSVHTKILYCIKTFNSRFYLISVSEWVSCNQLPEALCKMCEMCIGKSWMSFVGLLTASCNGTVPFSASLLWLYHACTFLEISLLKLSWQSIFSKSALNEEGNALNKLHKFTDETRYSVHRRSTKHLWDGFRGLWTWSRHVEVSYSAYFASLDICFSF